MLVLSGCMIGPRTISGTIGKETRQSLSQFAVPGKTTNIDILKKFKKPTYKFVRDDAKFSYRYFHLTANKKSSGFFSGVAQVELEQKTASFVFDKNGILEKFTYSEYFPYAGSITAPVIQIKNPSFEKKLYEYSKLKIGDHSEKIYKNLGQPSSKEQHNDKITTLIYKDLFALRGINIDVSDDVITYKYFYRVTELNDQEKAVLQQ